MTKKEIKEVWLKHLQNHLKGKALKLQCIIDLIKKKHIFTWRKKIRKINIFTK